MPVGPDAPGGKQHVDAAAGAEIEHGFAGVELGQRGRIAAAERSQHGLFRNLAGLAGVVEIRGDRIDATARAWGRAAAGASAGRDAQRRLAVFLSDDFFDFHAVFSYLHRSA